MHVPEMRFLYDDIIDLQPFYYEIKPGDGHQAKMADMP
jgi:hypothetical protein